MKTVTTVQENATDIYEGAKEINEERAAAEEAFEDAAEDETVPLISKKRPRVKNAQKSKQRRKHLQSFLQVFLKE